MRINEELEKAKRLGKTRDFRIVEIRPGDSSSPRAWRALDNGDLYDFVVSLPSPSTLAPGIVMTAYLPEPEPKPVLQSGNSWNKSAEFVTSPNGDRVRKREGWNKNQW